MCNLSVWTARRNVAQPKNQPDEARKPPRAVPVRPPAFPLYVETGGFGSQDRRAGPPAGGNPSAPVPFYAVRSISDATSPPRRMTSEVTYIHSSSTITVPSSPYVALYEPNRDM